MAGIFGGNNNVLLRNVAGRISAPKVGLMAGTEQVRPWNTLGNGEGGLGNRRMDGSTVPVERNPVGGGFSIPDDGSTPVAALPRPSGSAPTGFDYEALRAALLPPEKKHSKLHNTLVDIAEVAAPALMAIGGDQAGANDFIQGLQAQRAAKAQREWQVNKLLAEWQHADWADRNKAQLDAMAPYTLGQGQSRYVYDPITGQNREIQHEQPSWDEYARGLGNPPGSAGYTTAAQDYVLRGNGPSALNFDTQLDDARTANDIRLEGVRQTGRERMRGLPTYRDTHPRPVAPGRAKGRAGNAPTATGPNGEKVMWNGSAWVPVQ